MKIENNDGLAAAFRRDGFVLIRELLRPAQVPVLRSAVERLLADGLDRSGVRVFAPDALRALCGAEQEKCRHATAKELLSICIEDPLRTAVRSVVGPCVEFLSLKPVLKTDRIAAASPWHQDWPYWRGAHKVSAWIALDRCDPDNGCLRVVPGSHTRVWPHHRHNGPEGFGNRISGQDVATRWGAGAVRSLPMQPGDVVLFHDLLLHGSHANRDGRPRWALIPTYRDGLAADPHILPELWKAPVPM